MSKRIQTVTSDLSELATESRERFGGLSTAELNWKPSGSSWSVAQCLDHLITTHSLYFPLLRELQNGAPKATFWQRYSPLSGPFGKLLIQSMDPQNPKKVKTLAKAEPSSSKIAGDIVDRFCAHQAELMVLLKKISPDIDLHKTIITSPLMGIVTYSLDDCLTIFVVHGQRHLGQARRVTEAEGFGR